MTAEEILCLSYFDSIIGPSIFFCSNESKFDEFEHPNLKRILEFNEEEGTIIFAFRKYQTINHVFFMDSDLARGGKELLMITYMIKASYFKNEIVDVFKYLDLKDPILKEFASEIKKLKQLTEIFHVKKTEGDYQNMLQLGSNEFKKKFLKLFNNYFKKLLLGNDKLKPSYSQKNLKKIFIFGARGVGKSTFLKNLESVQFYKQENRDLPSQIYEIVIDNLRIITNDCYEREFDCFLCNNLGGCIQGAQGFIIIFDASDKHSLIGVKKRLKLIYERCDEFLNKDYEVPILLVGNKFENKEDVFAQNVYDTINSINLNNCQTTIHYSSLNILRENNKIMDALRWLIRHII